MIVIFKESDIRKDTRQNPNDCIAKEIEDKLLKLFMDMTSEAIKFRELEYAACINNINEITVFIQEGV